jgi:hypothetical protein
MRKDFKGGTIGKMVGWSTTGNSMKKIPASKLRIYQECTIRDVVYKHIPGNSHGLGPMGHLVQLVNNDIEFYVDGNLEVEVADEVVPDVDNKYVIMGTPEVGFNICTYDDREAAQEAIRYFGNEHGYPPSDFHIVRVGYLRAFLEDMEASIKKGY